MSLVRFRPEARADLAHLVERDLAKVEVAGSSPVIRSKKSGKDPVILPALFRTALGSNPDFSPRRGEKSKRVVPAE